MNEARCTGHCCKDFTLPISPMQFAWWRKLFSLGKNPRRDVGKYSTTMDTMDNRKIADMVMFLREDRKNSNGQVASQDPLYHYTCKHYDTKSGNCTNYESRPSMCSDYPYGRDCNYKGCTMRCESTCTKKVPDGLSERCQEAT